MGQAFDPYYTWLAIPPADQPPHHYRLLGIEPLESDRDVMLSAAAKAERRLAREIPEKDRTATVEMRERGLTVLTVDDERRAGWDDLARRFAEAMSRKVPPEIYEEALRHRSDFRKERGHEGSP